MRTPEGAASARSAQREDVSVITCYLRYEIATGKTAEFEDYARRWVDLVARFGGCHHGYYLPHESASDIAIALFSFKSLADYEAYRGSSAADPECQQAYRMAEKSGCIRRYERQFLKPLGPALRTPIKGGNR